MTALRTLLRRNGGGPVMALGVELVEARLEAKISAAMEEGR